MAWPGGVVLFEGRAGGWGWNQAEADLIWNAVRVVLYPSESRNGGAERKGKGVGTLRGELRVKALYAFDVSRGLVF